MNAVYVEGISSELSGEGVTKPAQIADASIRWSAIFSGLFVALLIYLALACLALALGGSTIQSKLLSGDLLQSLTVGASYLTAISALFSIAVGSYVSGRVGGVISTRIGGAQGLVIASLFFVLMATQAGLVLMGVGGGITSLLSGMAPSASSLRIIEDSIGDLKFNVPTSEVVKGLAIRVGEGNDQSAVTYLANQAGIDPQKARARYDSLKTRFTDLSRSAAEATARGLKYTGWSLFVTMVFGAFIGMFAGILGATNNLRSPLSEMDSKAMLQMRVSAVVLALVGAFLVLSAGPEARAEERSPAEDESSWHVPARKATPTVEGTHPYMGLQVGVGNPDDGFVAAAEHGLQIGYHPYIPHALAIQVTAFNTDRKVGGATEDLKRVQALGSWTFKFGEEDPIVKNFFLGAAAGAIFDTAGPYKGTHLGVAPVAGFDLPLAAGDRHIFSLGLEAKYLFVNGPSPDVFSTNGVLKYWF